MTTYELTERGLAAERAAETVSETYDEALAALDAEIDTLSRNASVLAAFTITTPGRIGRVRDQIKRVADALDALEKIAR